MAYEIDLEKVWDLPWCVGSMERNGSFCGLGKIINACGKSDRTDNPNYDTGFITELGSILRKYYTIVGAIFDSNVPMTVGWLHHDLPINDLETHEEKTQFHQNFTRQLLEILLKEGFIKLKDSDLAIVKELKQYEVVAV